METSRWQMALLGFALSSFCVFWIGRPFPPGLRTGTIVKVAAFCWLLACIVWLGVFLFWDDLTGRYYFLGCLLGAVFTNVSVICLLAVAQQTGASVLARGARQIIFAFQKVKAPALRL